MQHAVTLLDWYDVHARRLPWRVQPEAKAEGAIVDPYRVWLSEVMLQQTTVAAVTSYFKIFTKRWPSVFALAAAQDDDVMAAWAGLGYYARARNLLKCARVVADEMGGVFPKTESELLALPGVGPYTAAAVVSIAFDVPATVMDGNVERVMARMFAEETPLPKAKPLLKGYAASLTPSERPGDYAQAVMDLGATICTPRGPACGICPWLESCASREKGIAEKLPFKSPKKAKPVRRGQIYFLRRADGGVLLERRPEHGLLGGMMGLPGSVWAEQSPDFDPPIEAEWRWHKGAVRHTFTHFHLVLDLACAELPDGANTVGEFFTVQEKGPEDLPAVMKKAYLFGARSLL